MELYLIAALVVVAVVVLVGSVVAGRRGHDPASSVRDFTRALSALERTDTLPTGTAPRPPADSPTQPPAGDDEHRQVG